MLKLLCPDIYINDIYDIDISYLKSLNIKGILVDLDNTLLPWDEYEASPEVIEWVDTMKKEGFSLCMVSNNKARRIRRCAHQLNIPAVWGHFKPSRKAFRKGMSMIGTTWDQTVVIGDQIFTDIFGANRMGILAILVKPISHKELLWTKLMRKLEGWVLQLLKRREMIDIGF